MALLFRQTELYKFLGYCERSGLEKTILDCGAGGNCPPIALFNSFGYKGIGIEISDSQIEEAKKFAEKNNIELDIRKGDVRNLQFENESFSFIYSYNSIFHMSKDDLKKSIGEIKRILKPEGLAFVNVLSKDDCRFGDDEELGNGMFRQDEGDAMVVHSYFDDNEADSYFDGMKIIFKQKRVFDWYICGEKYKQSYIDYIVKKQNI